MATKLKFQKEVYRGKKSSPNGSASRRDIQMSKQACCKYETNTTSKMLKNLTFDRRSNGCFTQVNKYCQTVILFLTVKQVNDMNRNDARMIAPSLCQK